MNGPGQPGAWNSNPFGQPLQGYGNQQLSYSQPFQTAPNKPVGDGRGLDLLDAFASQGFQKPEPKRDAPKEEIQRPNYSNVPLSKIPLKPPTFETTTVPMLPPIQQPSMQPNFGMYATGVPQQRMPVGGHYGTSLGPGSMAHAFNTNPFEQQNQMLPAVVSQQQFPPGYPLQGMLAPAPSMPNLGSSMGGSIQSVPRHMNMNVNGPLNPPISTGPPPFGAPHLSNTSQGFQPPNFGTSPMGTNPRGMQVPGQVSNQWNPFGGNDSSMNEANNPAHQSNPFPQAANNIAWDPFNQPQQQQQQLQQHAAAAQDRTQINPNNGWGDLTDKDIWGEQAAQPRGGKSPGSDDEGAWSDDDPNTSDAGSASAKKDQEETDFQLALRLQREEEERASQRATGDSGRVNTLRNMNDKPDGECLARISKRTLLVKAWKMTYYIFELPDLLLLYRSRDDRIYNPRGAMIKKRVEIKHNHTLSPLTRKFYKDYGYLWHFTMEEQLDYGPSVIAKFAYQDKRPLEELGNRIAEAIREKRRTRMRLNNYHSYAQRASSPPPSYIYNASSDSPSVQRSAGGDKYSRWGNIPA